MILTEVSCQACGRSYIEYMAKEDRLNTHTHASTWVEVLFVLE